MFRKIKILFFSILVVSLGLVIVVPNLLHHRTVSSLNACSNNLRLIEGAKQQWAIGNGRTNGPVTWDDLLPYLAARGERNVEIPRCPKGGTYTIGNVGE